MHTAYVRFTGSNIQTQNSCFRPHQATRQMTNFRISSPEADRRKTLRVFGCLPNTVGRAPMAGVRKAWREETAGKLATALMRAYEDLGTAREGFSMSRMGAKAGWRVDGLFLSIGRRVRRNFCVDRTTFQRPAKAGLVISGRAPP
jgi:hypothetical protein